MNIKLFDKWDISGIVVSDMGIKDYVNLRPFLVPKNCGRYAHLRFHKNKLKG